MGWKIKKFEFKLNPNEELDKTLYLEHEKRAAIHGIVKFPNGTPVKDAVVKLFRKKRCKPCELEPVTFTFTDECGQFLFGVDSCVEYLVKIFFYEPECHPRKEKLEDDKNCFEIGC